MELCFFHYWLERGRPKNEFTFHHWKMYKELHPIRVSRWCQEDNDLNNFLNGCGNK